jgi:hypothetical protein
VAASWAHMEPGSRLADAVDWAIVGLSGVVALACAGGALYVYTYGGSSMRRVGSSFNYLWRSRFCFQLTAACYALAQLLRLQVCIAATHGMMPAICCCLCNAWPAVTLACGAAASTHLYLQCSTCVYRVPQVLWGPDSVFGPGAAYPQPLCRAYIALEYGLLEPVSLLLALFACIYSVQVGFGDPFVFLSHPANVWNLLGHCSATFASPWCSR